MVSYQLNGNTRHEVASNYRYQAYSEAFLTGSVGTKVHAGLEYTMLFRRKEGVDVDVFWKEREEALGTAIRGKVLGKVIREENNVPLWGLFYTTANAVYFQTFQSENWLSMLFPGGTRSRTRDEIIEIPIESLRVFRVIQKKRGLLGIFAPPSRIEMTWTARGGETISMLFEVMEKAEAFVATLPEVPAVKLS